MLDHEDSAICKIHCLLRIESLIDQIWYHQYQCTTWTQSSKS